MTCAHHVTSLCSVKWPHHSVWWVRLSGKKPAQLQVLSIQMLSVLRAFSWQLCCFVSSLSPQSAEKIQGVIHARTEGFNKFPIFAQFHFQGLGAGGKRRGWSLMRRKVSFWQGLRAGQLEAEPQYQVFTHKGPPSFLPLSAKSKNPVGNSLWTWTREALFVVWFNYFLV